MSRKEATTEIAGACPPQESFMSLGRSEVAALELLRQRQQLGYENKNKKDERQTRSAKGQSGPEASVYVHPSPPSPQQEQERGPQEARAEAGTTEDSGEIPLNKEAQAATNMEENPSTPWDLLEYDELEDHDTHIETLKSQATYYDNMAAFVRQFQFVRIDPDSSDSDSDKPVSARLRPRSGDIRYNDYPRSYPSRRRRSSRRRAHARRLKARASIGHDPDSERDRGSSRSHLRDDSSEFSRYTGERAHTDSEFESQSRDLEAESYVSEGGLSQASSNTFLKHNLRTRKVLQAIGESDSKGSIQASLSTQSSVRKTSTRTSKPSNNRLTRASSRTRSSSRTPRPRERILQSSVRARSLPSRTSSPPKPQSLSKKPRPAPKPRSPSTTYKRKSTGFRRVSRVIQEGNAEWKPADETESEESNGHDHKGSKRARGGRKSDKTEGKAVIDDTKVQQSETAVEQTSVKGSTINRRSRGDRRRSRNRKDDTEWKPGEDDSGSGSSDYEASKRKKPAHRSNTVRRQSRGYNEDDREWRPTEGEDDASSEEIVPGKRTPSRTSRNTERYRSHGSKSYESKRQDEGTDFTLGEEAATERDAPARSKNAARRRSRGPKEDRHAASPHEAEQSQDWEDVMETEEQTVVSARRMAKSVRRSSRAKKQTDKEWKLDDHDTGSSDDASSNRRRPRRRKTAKQTQQVNADVEALIETETDLQRANVDIGADAEVETRPPESSAAAASSGEAESAMSESLSESTTSYNEANDGNYPLALRRSKRTIQPPTAPVHNANIPSIKRSLRGRSAARISAKIPGIKTVSHQQPSRTPSKRTRSLSTTKGIVNKDKDLRPTTRRRKYTQGEATSGHLTIHEKTEQIVIEQPETADNVIQNEVNVIIAAQADAGTHDGTHTPVVGAEPIYEEAELTEEDTIARRKQPRRSSSRNVHKSTQKKSRVQRQTRKSIRVHHPQSNVDAEVAREIRARPLEGIESAKRAPSLESRDSSENQPDRMNRFERLNTPLQRRGQVAGQGRDQTLGQDQNQDGLALNQTTSERTPSPSLPSDVVKISAETPDALAKAVRALTTSNYDIVESTTPGVLPTTLLTERSVSPMLLQSLSQSHNTSFTGSLPPALDASATSSHNNSPAYSILQWTDDHWHELKRLYEETKNAYMQEEQTSVVRTDLYNEVARKFYELDPIHQNFQRELRGRIMSIEHAGQERQQRRGSVDSTASYVSHFSATRYNSAYSQMHQDYPQDSFNKRKLNEVEISSEHDNELMDIPKRRRVEEAREPSSPQQLSSRFSLFGLLSWGSSVQSAEVSENSDGIDHDNAEAQSQLHQADVTQELSARSSEQQLDRTSKSAVEMEQSGEVSSGAMDDTQGQSDNNNVSGTSSSSHSSTFLGRLFGRA